MMVFWNARLVFLAVPKTGTQAYSAALGAGADIVIRHPPEMKHMTAQKFRRRFMPLMPSGKARLETCAVIRDPVDWLGSWYRYRGRAALDGHPNSTAGISFDQFVAAYLSDHQPAYASIGSQARFVSDREGHVIVDHLFAYETPQALNDFLSARLGQVFVQPEQRNVSPRAATVLSEELARHLQIQHAADFALHHAVSAGQRPTPG